MVIPSMRFQATKNGKPFITIDIVNKEIFEKFFLEVCDEMPTYNFVETSHSYEALNFNILSVSC